MSTPHFAVCREIALGVVNKSHDDLLSAFADDPQGLSWSVRALGAYLENAETEVSVARAAFTLLAVVANDLR